MGYTYLYTTLEYLQKNIDKSMDECIALYGFIKFKGPDYIVNIHDSISVVEYSSTGNASNNEIVEDFETIKEYISNILVNLLYVYGVGNEGYSGVNTYIYRYHSVRYNLKAYYQYLESKEYESYMEYVYCLRYFGMYAHYDGYRGRMIFSTNRKPFLDAFIKEATDFDILEYDSDTTKLRLRNRKTNTIVRVLAISLQNNDMFSRYSMDSIMADNKVCSFSMYKIVSYTISPKYIRPLPVKQFGHTNVINGSPVTRERPDIAKFSGADFDGDTVLAVPKHNIGEHPGEDHAIDAMMHSIDSINRKDTFSDILQADWELAKPKNFIGKIGAWLNERV